MSGRRLTSDERAAQKIIRAERNQLAQTPDGITNIRKQVIRIVEAWGVERDVNVRELVYRLHCLSLKPEDPT